MTIPTHSPARPEQNGAPWPGASTRNHQTNGNVEARHRCLGVFGVRESTKNNLDEFLAMCEQTYQNAIHIPEIRAINALGDLPLREKVVYPEVEQADGTFITVPVEVKHITHGAGQAIKFELGGYVHLWARESAHEELEEVEGHWVNPFTKMLVDVIRQHRPVTLYAATPSRMARNLGQMNVLLGALPHNVDEVKIANETFDLTPTKRALTMMHLYFVLWAAAQERDAIVTRFATGRIAAARRGTWPFGSSIVPFGHFIDDTGALQPDPSLRDAVGQMMSILASDKSDKQKRRQLNRVGVTNMRFNSDHSERDLVGSQTDPTTLVNTFMSWAPVWVQGEYLMRHGGTYPKAETLSGIEIVRRHPEDDGELQMLVAIPQLPNGWADKLLVQNFADAARARFNNRRAEQHQPRPLSKKVREESADPDFLAAILPSAYGSRMDAESRRARLGSRGQEHISAFSGRTWSDDHHQFELRMYPRGYLIARKPLNAVDNAAGRPIGYLSHDKFTKNLLPALADAARTGIPVEFRPTLRSFDAGAGTHIIDARAHTIKRLKKAMKDERARAKRANQNSNDPRLGDEQVEDYKQEAAGHYKRVSLLKAELAEATAQTPLAPTDPNTFDVYNDVWLPAIRAVTGAQRIPQEKYQNLEDVLRDVRLTRTDGIWAGTATLRLNTSNGYADVGPITWPIGHGGGRGTQELTARHTNAHHQSIRDFNIMREALEVEAKLTEPAALVVLNSSFAELGHVIIHATTGQPYPAWVGPQWRDPDFAAWVTSIYTNPNFSWSSQYSEGSPSMQLCLDALEPHAVPVEGQVILDAYPAASRHTLKVLGSGDLKANPRVPQRNPAARALNNKSGFATRMFEPFTCSAGHRATIAARVPELVTDLLCGCGRMAGKAKVPFPADLVFPDEYQLLRIPHDEAVAIAAEETAARQTSRLGALQALVLATLSTREPATLRQLNETLIADGNRRPGSTTAAVFVAATSLKRFGLVEDDGSRPPRWAITDRGRKHPSLRP